jgi:hypothetical protein
MDRLAEVCWKLAVWRRLRDELLRRRLPAVTLWEALAWLDAEPGDPIAALLTRSLARKDDA